MSILSGLGKFLRDLFTGPDGKTYHLGKVASVPILGVGLAIPITALFRGEPILMTDVGVLLGGIASAFLLMVRGTKNVDQPGEDSLLRTIVQRTGPPLADPHNEPLPYQPYGDYQYGYPQEARFAQGPEGGEDYGSPIPQPGRPQG